MKYVTTIERMAKEKGKDKGKIEEKQTIAINMLNDSLSLEQISRLTGLSIAQLQQLQFPIEQD